MDEARARTGPRPVPEGVVAGAIELLNGLVPTEEDRLRRVVRKALGYGIRRRGDVEDVVQETWARAFARLAQLQARDPSGVRHWLTQIARHCALDSLRRHERGQTLTLAEPDAPSRGRRAGKRRETHESRTRVLGRLGPEERMVVWLRGQGMCWETVRLVMGKSTARVARRVHARAQVRLPILRTLY